MGKDPLDMTVRALLEQLTAARVDSDWINIRNDQWPWKHIVAAAERGEVAVSRVGRRLLMKRSELDRWLEAHTIEQRETVQHDLSHPPSHMEQMLANAGFRRNRAT